VITRLSVTVYVPAGPSTAEVIEFGDPKVAVSCTDQHEDWAPGGAGDEISRTFTFRDFHETMSFVNAVAWIANQEGHHPDLTVGYDRCTVRYATHSIGGLSENDFICAAKVNALLAY